MDSAGLTYLTIAYSAFFLVLAFYLGRIRRRDRELWSALKDLEARLPGADGGP